MSTKAFNKRLHFVAIAANKGFKDCVYVSEWYCNQTRRNQAEIDNQTLLDWFITESKSHESQAVNL